MSLRGLYIYPIASISCFIMGLTRLTQLYSLLNYVLAIFKKMKTEQLNFNQMSEKTS